jgi:hypothetical protein
MLQIHPNARITLVTRAERLTHTRAPSDRKLGIYGIYNQIR